MIASPLRVRPGVLLSWFLRECGECGLDVGSIGRIASTTAAYLSGNADAREQMAPAQALESRRYAALEAGTVDWSVYESDWYLGELWACWSVYSRKYLSAITVPTSLPPYGVVADIGTVDRVLDLGCGIGVTTVALRSIFPDAHLVATNLEGTIQTRIAKRFGERFGFDVLPVVPRLKTDLVFASEYFEHVPAPLAHLREVVAATEARAFLIANSFNTRAIGHFLNYEVDGESLSGDVTARRFNDEMRKLGYEKVKTKLWNNRPSYWRRA